MKNYILAFLKPGRRTSLALVMAIILAAMLLSYFDLIEPAREALESKKMTFKIAGGKFTAYQIVSGLVAVIVLFWIASIAASVLERAIGRISGLNPSNQILLAKALQIALYFVLFMLALDIFGVSLTAFAVFSGALGVGIGLGLQKVTANFISGIILLIEKSVKPGDLVDLGAGVTGFIRHIGIRHTRLETGEGKEIMIPNEDFMTSRVGNWTFSSNRSRVEMRIGVSYDSDLELARRLMIAAACEHPLCSHVPGPECFLQEFGEKSVLFILFFWIEDVTSGTAGPRNDVLLSIWRKFQDNGVDFPQAARREVSAGKGA